MRARMPADFDPVGCRVDVQRRSIIRGLGALICLGSGLVPAGCSLWKKEQDPEEARLQRLMKVPEPPAMIREAAYTTSLQYLRVQSYGIVNNLVGTGGIEPPSMERDLLLRELQLRNVENPNQFIDSPNTAIVLVETVLVPGHREGDPVDIVVRTPLRTDLSSDRCTSLQYGWLMPTRMAFTQVMNDGKPRSSDVLAIATGPLITRSAHEKTDDPHAKLSGRILGGGRVQKTGKLELLIRSDYRHVAISKRLSDVINRRFFYFDGTTRKGIANAREDDLIELEVSERYRQNVHRMMQVILAMGTDAELGKMQQRLEPLERQLFEPTTAQDAALQLEGIGQEGIPILLKGIGAGNPEIRFYASEALAYMDHEEAIDSLVELTRDHPAFRYQALLALSGMPQQQAIVGLQRLFDETSVETRCGAFDAIRRRKDRVSVLRGAKLTDGPQEIATLYEFPSRGGPLVSVSLRRSPDIVIFGGPQGVKLDQPLLCAGGLVVIQAPQDSLQINRVVTGRPEAQMSVPATIHGLCAGIARVGGSYGDIVECLRLLKEQGGFEAPLAIDILPEPLREYHREPAQLDPAPLPNTLPPQSIDPPKVEEQRAWYDPRGWIGRIDLPALQRFT